LIKGGQFDYLNFRDFQIQLQKKYGDIAKWGLFKKQNVYLSNCDHIRELYKHEGPTPYRSIVNPIVKLYENVGVHTSLFNR
jgi:hypothetical protein